MAATQWMDALVRKVEAMASEHSVAPPERGRPSRPLPQGSDWPLSPELSMYVALFLDVTTMLRLGQTCRFLQDVVADEYLWALMCKSAAFRRERDRCTCFATAAPRPMQRSWREEFMDVHVHGRMKLYSGSGTCRPLHAAATRGLRQCAEIMLASGHRPTQWFENTPSYARTAVHAAAAGGHTSILERLLDHARAAAPSNAADVLSLEDALCGGGAASDLSLYDVFMTPLDVAVQEGHTECARTLLAHGAPVDAATLDGRTALHYATEGGHGEAAAMLLAWKADANAADRDGLTPLHLAAQQGKVHILSLLLSRGADVSKADQVGMTPIQYAEDRMCRELLRGKGVVDDDDDDVSPSVRDSEVRRSRVTEGVNANEFTKPYDPRDPETEKIVQRDHRGLLYKECVDPDDKMADAIYNAIDAKMARGRRVVDEDEEDPPEKVFPCAECGAVLRGAADYLEHVTTAAHTQKKPARGLPTTAATTTAGAMPPAPPRKGESIYSDDDDDAMPPLPAAPAAVAPAKPAAGRGESIYSDDEDDSTTAAMPPPPLPPRRVAGARAAGEEDTNSFGLGRRRGVAPHEGAPQSGEEASEAMSAAGALLADLGFTVGLVGARDEESRIPVVHLDAGFGRPAKRGRDLAEDEHGRAAKRARVGEGVAPARSLADELEADTGDEYHGEGSAPAESPAERARREAREELERERAEEAAATPARQESVAERARREARQELERERAEEAVPGGSEALAERARREARAELQRERVEEALIFDGVQRRSLADELAADFDDEVIARPSGDASGKKRVTFSATEAPPTASAPDAAARLPPPRGVLRKTSSFGGDIPQAAPDVGWAVTSGAPKKPKTDDSDDEEDWSAFFGAGAADAEAEDAPPLDGDDGLWELRDPGVRPRGRTSGALWPDVPGAPGDEGKVGDNEERKRGRAIKSSWRGGKNVGTTRAMLMSMFK